MAGGKPIGAGVGHRENVRVRVQLIDPSGDVAPYDHALAAALARRGAEVELVTSRFVHGPAAEPDGYAVDRRFYRLATRFGAERPALRRGLKLAEHVPDMLRYRHHARLADIRHYQWLPLAQLDRLAAATRAAAGPHAPQRPAGGRGSSAGCSTGWTRSSSTRDAGAELLTAATASPPSACERSRTAPSSTSPTSPTRRRFRRSSPRRGPGRAVLRRRATVQGRGRAARGLPDVEAELWVVGRPLGESMERLRRLAPPGRVRFVPRYVSDRELPAFFRRADLLVLPHRRVDVSGVLFAGLAFGKPMVLSDVAASATWPRSTAPRGSCRRRTPRRSGAAIRALLDDPARAAELGGGRAPRPRALLLGPDRGTDARPLPGASHEGRVHGQEQALGRPRARLAGGPRLRGGGRGGLGAGRVDR